MGGAPNYNKFKTFIASVRTKEQKIKREIISVASGKGKYPLCLKEKLYETCPKETPENPESVPQECKLCPQFVESPFHIERSHEARLKRLKEAGLPTRIEE